MEINVVYEVVPSLLNNAEEVEHAHCNNTTAHLHPEITNMSTLLCQDFREVSISGHITVWKCGLRSQDALDCVHTCT